MPVSLAMRSSVPGVFAAGDVIGPRQLTHLAVLEGEVAGANAARDVVGGKGGRGGSRRMDYSVVPSVVFTDPPFARVGLSEREAREQGFRYAVSRVDYKDVVVAEVLGQTHAPHFHPSASEILVEAAEKLARG